MKRTSIRNEILKGSILFFLINIISGIFVADANAYSNIRFDNITIEDGLAQATVETMIQDPNGYMWFGTNDGLTRYNGNDFKTYRNQIGVKNSICGNYIVSLYSDYKNNNIYSGTTSGLSKINLNSYEITNYTSEDGLSNDNITDILVTTDNKLIVGTSNGLNIYDEDTGKFNRIFDGTMLDNQEIYSLSEDDEGLIWVGSESGLNRLNLETNASVSYTNGDLKILDGCVYDVVTYGDVAWIGTSGKGVYKYNYKTKECTEINKSNSNIISDYIKNIFKDNDGTIWIATEEGLVKYVEQYNSIKVYTNKVYDTYSLVNSDVFTIMEDKSGLIWVGTYGGVSTFNPDSKIEHYKVDDEEFGLTDNMIHGICQDDDGVFWIGTNTKGLNVLDIDNEKSFYLDDKSSPYALSNNTVNDVKGYKNKIFIGTNDGLNILNKDTNEIKVYNEEQGLINRRIKTIMYDSKGYLWIGTPNGVSVLNLETEEIVNLDKLFKENNIEDTYVDYIYEDKQGVYWLGLFLNGGLVKLDSNNQSVKVYKYSDTENSISNNAIRVITEDEEENLWIGTSNGLNKFDKKTEIFKSYSTLDGLANNTVYGILYDRENNLWMSTNYGISKYDKAKDRFYNLTTKDGLQSNEFNGMAFCKTKDGRMVFGGINGLNIFNPEDIFKNQFQGNVEFDEFTINSNNIKDLNNMTLAHDENNIGIKLFIADFKNLNNIEYYYKLEGGDGKWTLLEDNEVLLSNLSPGNYTFSVKAKIANEEFSDTSTISFKIEPTVWKSPIAIILYSAAIGIIIGAIIDSKNEKMKVLDNMVTERTMKLHEEMKKNTELLNKVIKLEKNKNAYLVNISHELRTPLNVLSSMEQLISELNRSEDGISKEKIDHYMEISKKNIRRLLKLINDLIDTSKIEHGNYNIKIDRHDIVYIVEETALSIKDYIESKNIDLIIDPEVEECMIDCDATEIERCIINLVNNAAKFTEPGGRILISLVELENEVKIEVSDTGIGIEEKYLKIIFNRFNQVVDSRSETKGGSGLGLTITKLIVELHKGKIFAESTVNVGSKFTIILPKRIEDNKLKIK